MPGILSAVSGALLLAGVSTFGDFVWASLQLEHRAIYGLIHGTLLCATIGLYLGVLRRRAVAGTSGGAIIGFFAAAGFYGLARFAGMTAMFPLWMALWMGFALLDAHVLRDHLEGERRTPNALLRGALAAVGSGLAFYAISGIWLSGAPGGPRYGVNLLSWTVAFLPGFLALLVRPAGAGR